MHVCQSATGDRKWNADKRSGPARWEPPDSLASFKGEIEQNLFEFADDFINHDEKVFML